MTKSFDYVIVGGGTAGLTVASRLSEDVDVSVLVVEAGSNHVNDPMVQGPGLFSPMYGDPKYDWNFLTVPQVERNNRRLAQPRGKQLGGSSALNFEMILYPTRDSLDSWAAVGNPGWDYSSMSPYFRKFATVHPPAQSTKDIYGVPPLGTEPIGNGPVQISYGSKYEKTNKAWMETFSELGLDLEVEEQNRPKWGAFQEPATIDPKTKTRSYAATAYYPPEVASRENLTVLTDTLVKKIIFDTTTPEPVARGILTEGADGTESIYNGREIILAAGALMTPQILELSGIGSKDLLGSLGIPVVLDNPFVGENLQDHNLVCQSFEVLPGVPSSDVTRDPAVLQQLVQQYMETKEGPLSQSSISLAYAPFCDASGICSEEARKEFFSSHEQYIKTADDRAIRDILMAGKEPPVEFYLFPGQVNTALQNPTSMLDYLTPAQPENYIGIFTQLNRPFSRGNIHITSADVHEKPRYDPKFGSNPLDTEISARHVQFVEKLIKTSPLSKLLKQDGARVPNIKADSLENAREIVRQSEVTVFHPSGSCGMRPREHGGVVDERLRVHGVKRLRVVDASVFPLEPVGNIQSVVYAVAEKAADLIKQDRKAYWVRGLL